MTPTDEIHTVERVGRVLSGISLIGEARNALVVRAADALIAVGGAYGTLSEIAFALKAGKPVAGLGTWDVDGVTVVDSPEAAVESVLGDLST